jgi:hypothetical protein
VEGKLEAPAKPGGPPRVAADPHLGRVELFPGTRRELMAKITESAGDERTVGLGFMGLGTALLGGARKNEL